MNKDAPFKVAFVIDGKVVDILNTQARLAAILLSEPVIVDLSNLEDDAGHIPNIMGFDYDAKTGKFTPPSE